MPRAKMPRAYPREFFAILEQIGEQGGKEVKVKLEGRLIGMKLAGKYWAFRGALRGSALRAAQTRAAMAQEAKSLGKAITQLDPELEREEELSRIADQVTAQVRDDGVTFCHVSDSWQAKALRAAMGTPESAESADESERALLAKLGPQAGERCVKCGSHRHANGCTNGDCSMFRPY